MSTNQGIFPLKPFGKSGLTLFSLYKQPLIAEMFVGKEGVGTRNDELFMRMFWEVPINNISPKARWILTDKAGDYRRWYMGCSYLMDWERDGYRIKNYRNDDGSLRSRPQNTQYLFKEGVSWGKIGSGIPSFRWRPKGFGFNDAAPTLFGENVYKSLGPLNSVVIRKALTIRGSTLNITTGVVEELPILTTDNDLSERDQVIVGLAIEIATQDWNSFETSWDFTLFPPIAPGIYQPNLSATFIGLRELWNQTTWKMQELEEENNRIFIEAYCLQDELTPDVPLSEITLTCNPHYRYGPGKSEEELEELLRADTMKELVSYAVGCMMGRYSLDAPGLIYAHSGNDQFWEIYHQKHNQPLPSHPQNHSCNSCNSCNSWLSFSPDGDGIIPITDTDWFPDDAANRFIQFISVAWPKEHLEENLQFIADSLYPNRGESPRETIRRYMAAGFFKHHLKMYKKRPIYWLFTSGKFRAFQCLVYLHRYNEGTLSRMRTEYVIPLQGKFAARIEQLAGDMDAATSTAHRKKLERERDKLVKQQAELQAFDERLRHYADMRIALDLDDGVKVNYGKFGELLGEVGAITGKK
jgi:hypothetical protein